MTALTAQSAGPPTRHFELFPGSVTNLRILMEPHDLRRWDYISVVSMHGHERVRAAACELGHLVDGGRGRESICPGVHKLKQLGQRGWRTVRHGRRATKLRGVRRG